MGDVKLYSLTSYIALYRLVARADFLSVMIMRRPFKNSMGPCDLSSSEWGYSHMCEGEYPYFVPKTHRF